MMPPFLSGMIRFTLLTVALSGLAGCGAQPSPPEKIVRVAGESDVAADSLTLYDAVALSLQAQLDERAKAIGQDIKKPDIAYQAAESADPMTQSWFALDHGIDFARAARESDPQALMRD